MQYPSKYFLFLSFLLYGLPIAAQDILPPDAVQEMTLDPLTEVTNGSPESDSSLESELYEQGRHYLAQQRLDLAQKSFEEVLEKYEGTPESILAGFWLGEFKLRLKDYSGASLAYGQAYGALKKVQKQKSFSPELFHGEEGRLPEILAKLAYSLKMIKKREDACITLRQIKRDYKVRPITLEWYTTKLSKELKCR